MTVDTATAVAALLAAKDVPGLEQAITDASFLDAIPGEDRQKLRGASRRIREPLNARSAADDAREPRADAGRRAIGSEGAGHREGVREARPSWGGPNG